VRVRIAALFLGFLSLAGCSGSSDNGEVSSSETLDELAKSYGTEIALTPGTSDLAPGPVRFTFLVLDAHGRPIERPSARIWIARARDAVPFAQATALFLPAGVPGDLDKQHSHPGQLDDHSDVGETGVYVLNTRIDRSGTYWVLARPAGVTRVQALGNLIVRPRSESPAVGAKAPASNTPTLGDTPLNLLTTKVPPDRALLRYSIADSLRRHKPFVATFATPGFCTSRVCGPTVDVVDRVRRAFAGRDVRFIHVEIYVRNNPKNGLNRFVKQWNLPTEPWTFVVGRDGRITAKFEGVVSVGELRAAVRRTLLTR
jgi:hypothetical protein